jgi:hypothetical protein
MKSLDKIVDKIIKIEPKLQEQLVPLKSKWEKSNRLSYWKQLLKILNKEITPQHPRRLEIQNIFISRRVKGHRKLQTFEPPSQLEGVVGVLPEPIDCKIRRYDRMQIDLSKKVLEARMTHNYDLMSAVMRQYEKLDLKQKQVWMEIKDHFDLWKVDDPTSFFIREKDRLLVLTSVKINPNGGNSGPINGGDSPEGFIKLDPELLKKFMKYFNLNPPPGLLPPPGNE